jgi:hypothetical protein
MDYRKTVVESGAFMTTPEHLLASDAPAVTENPVAAKANRVRVYRILVFCGSNSHLHAHFARWVQLALKRTGGDHNWERHFRSEEVDFRFRSSYRP